MKKVLFISVTDLDLKEKETVLHLKKKFEGLSKEIKIYVLTKGTPFSTNVWGANFYLLKPGIFFWPLAFFVAFYLCLTKQINTIIAQSPLIEGFVGSILKRIFKKELIVEIHGDWIEGPFLSKKRKFESLQKKIVPFLARTSFKNADKIRGVADCLVERAKKIAPEKKYFKFHTFTDLSLFLEEKNTELEKFILFVGHLEEVKGVEYLIRAFSEISSDFNDFKLILVGEGEKKQELMDLASSLKINDNVEFKGRLSLEETKNIMKNCYVFVLPSLSEGLPRVLMEAMAMGKAIIASRVAGVPEIIKHNENGFLFEAKDTKGLVEKLKILLENKSLVEQMGRKGRQIAEQRFSNEQYIKHYISMINA